MNYFKNLWLRMKVYFPARDMAYMLDDWLFEANDTHTREDILKTMSYAAQGWEFWFEDVEISVDEDLHRLRVHATYKEIHLMFILGEYSCGSIWKIVQKD